MTTRTPEVEAAAERMRERRSHLARNIRQARILVEQGRAEGQNYLNRVRRVTVEQGYLCPNPDRAAACKAFEVQHRATYAVLTANLIPKQQTEEGRAMLEATRKVAELYAILAATARY